jgi:hypothetical protein
MIYASEGHRASHLKHHECIEQKKTIEDRYKKAMDPIRQELTKWTSSTTFLEKQIAEAQQK